MIISRLFSVAGDMDGMPVIQETGLCTNDDATMNAIRRYENEALQFSRVPRRAGLTVKTLDGSGVAELYTVADQQIGRFPNCVQNGRTLTKLAAPVQPIGPFAGKAIISYSRTWVQLQE
jgi:hypothetical protein